MDNGHFEMVNGHLWGAECSRKLRFREEKLLMTKYVTLFNTRRLIDSSYLVGGIHTVQVKIKSVIILSLAFLAELLLSLLLFPCSRLPFAAGHKFFIDSLPKGPQLSFFRNALI